MPGKIYTNVSDIDKESQWNQGIQGKQEQY